MTLMMATWFLAVQAASAQVSISGRVSGKDGDVLPGAHVVVEGTFMATIALKDGSFNLQGMKEGTYRIRASYMGYQTSEVTAVFKRDTVINFELTPAAIMGEEVVIRGARAGEKAPVTYSTLDEGSIRKTNQGQDMPFLLQYLPSVVSTSDAGTGIGYTSLRIRGTDQTRINVTMNGIPLNDAESQGVWWVDLPDIASSVEDIQVQRGVGTSTNGPAAFGATLGLRTRQPSPESFAELHLGAGSFSTWKAMAGAGTGLLGGRWAFEGRASRTISDGYIDRASSDLASYYFTGGYYGEKHIVKATVFSGNEETYQAWDGVPGYLLDSLPTYNGLGMYLDAGGNTAYYKDQTDNYRQDHYQLYWAHQPHRPWGLNLALHYTRGAGYYEEYKVEQEFADYGIPPPVIEGDTVESGDLVRRRWLENDFFGMTFGIHLFGINKLTLTFGGSGSYYMGDHFGEIIWSQVAVIYDKDHRWYENTGNKADGNLYVKIGLDLNSRMSLYGDMQLRGVGYDISGIDNDLRDISQEHRHLFFNPKLGLSWSPGPASRVYGSLAIGHREPNRSTLVDANPAKPYPRREVLYDAEAGYAFRKDRFSLESNIFIMVYRDQLVLTGKINDVGDPVMENVPQSYRIGLEAACRVPIAKKIDWYVNSTLSLNKITDFTEYVDDWDNWPEQVVNELGTTDIAFSPSMVAAGILSYRPWGFLELALYSKYVGSQYIDNTSSDARKLDPYFVNDLMARFSRSFGLLKELSLTLKVYNLFNTSYITNAWVYRYYSQGDYGAYDGYFPQAGAYFMASLQARF
jgi:iron complex outermembrane receptor protein